MPHASPSATIVVGERTMEELMSELQVAVTEDRSHLVLRIGSGQIGLNASELENLMRHLALLRTKLEPPMPDEPMTNDTIRSSVFCQRWDVGFDPGTPKLIRLSLQHLGFGWITIPLTEHEAEQMQDAMQRTLQMRPALS